MKSLEVICLTDTHRTHSISFPQMYTHSNMDNTPKENGWGKMAFT